MAVISMCIKKMSVGVFDFYIENRKKTFWHIVLLRKVKMQIKHTLTKICNLPDWLS